MIASNVSTQIQNKRDIGGLENAQIRARLENALTIARMIRERMDRASKERTKTAKSVVQKQTQAGLRSWEWAHWTPALREHFEDMLMEGAARTRAVGLRGLEQTQGEEAWLVRGTVIDRVV